jgi:hypothetical protein
MLCLIADDTLFSPEVHKIRARVELPAGVWLVLGWNFDFYSQYEYILTIRDEARVQLHVLACVDSFYQESLLVGAIFVCQAKRLCHEQSKTEFSPSFIRSRDTCIDPGDESAESRSLSRTIIFAWELPR